MAFGVSSRPPGMTIDHTAAARRMAELVALVPDDALGDPTPCADYTVAALLDHVAFFADAFARKGRKEADDPTAGPPPKGEASHLPPDWRTSMPASLAALADAWSRPEAWEGSSQAGGFDLPAEVVGLIALEELVVHGWDLARATGQPFEPSAADLEASEQMLRQFTGGDAPSPDGPYGPARPVEDTASPLDRVIALSGRDPAWRP